MKTYLVIFTGIFFGLFYFTFQLYLISNYLDIDVANYYLEIKEGYLFHPHHLFYNFTGWIFIEITKGFLNLTDFLKLKILNILAGSLGSSLLFFIFYKLSKKLILSFLFFLYFVFSFDYWFYSQINDTAFFTVFSSFLYLSFLFFVYDVFPNSLISFLLGIILAIAVGYHQTNIFLYLIGFFYIIKKNKDTKSKIYNLFFYTLGAILFISAFYLFAGHFFYGYSLKENTKDFIHKLPKKGNFYDWVFLYGHWDQSLQWGTFERDNLGSIISESFSNALFYNTINLIYLMQNLTNEITSFKVEILLYLIFFVSFLLNFIVSLLIIVIKRNVLILGFLSVLVIQLVFFSWWEPSNKEFWFSPLFILTFLQFLNINELFNSIKVSTIRNFIYFLFCYFFFGFVSLIIAQNSFNFFLPKKQTIYLGHWEDIRDLSYFSLIMDADFKVKFQFQTSKKELIQQKLNFLKSLRKKLLATETVYASIYILHFEQTLLELSKLVQEEGESLDLEEYYKELDLLKNHWEDWLKGNRK
ncbi:MAG: O-antigen polymerase [Leptonema sp. (in: bacteria)]